jgi:hypothetical protein
MLRTDPSHCQPGDWVPMMEFPDWDGEASPHSWGAPDGSLWHFGFTCVPTLDDELGEVGRDFVWMRFDPALGPPPPPQGVNIFRTVEPPRPPDPADGWKQSE